MNMYAHELEAAQSIAKKAGVIMLKYFHGDQRTQIKSDGSPVTVADTLINLMVIKELSTLFPDDVVIGEEESTGEYGMDRRWFCDPIDGTKAYTWGTPTAMFSLGLVVDGKPVMGVTYDPFLDRLFWAVKGQGAFCNGQPIHVSDNRLADGTVAVSSSVWKLRRSLLYLDTLIDQGIQMAPFSGAVYKMMLVATGRMVAYTESGVNGHDVAASQVIVEEAGGKVTGIDGSEYDYSRPLEGTLGSNGLVHDEMVTIVSGSSLPINKNTA